MLPFHHKCCCQDKCYTYCNASDFLGDGQVFTGWNGGGNERQTISVNFSQTDAYGLPTDGSIVQAAANPVSWIWAADFSNLPEKRITDAYVMTNPCEGPLPLYRIRKQGSGRVYYTYSLDGNPNNAITPIDGITDGMPLVGPGTSTPIVATGPCTWIRIYDVDRALLLLSGVEQSYDGGTTWSPANVLIDSDSCEPITSALEEHCESDMQCIADADTLFNFSPVAALDGATSATHIPGLTVTTNADNPAQVQQFLSNATGARYTLRATTASLGDPIEITHSFSSPLVGTSMRIANITDGGAGRDEHARLTAYASLVEIAPSSIILEGDVYLHGSGYYTSDTINGANAVIYVFDQFVDTLRLDYHIGGAAGGANGVVVSMAGGCAA